MPPALAARPLTREAARRAGAGLAQKAASVYKAIVQGPEAEPAGYGVEIPRVQQALPYLSDAQLVHCSSHFGQRGRAVGDVASALASELSWRLRPQGGEASGDSVSTGLTRKLRADEVTTVFYSFSKVTPQLPEYRLLYDAISDGLLEGLWTLNHLQSVLIATALADTDTRLADALPAVLQPLLAELVESEQVREDMNVDTLRYLVHAAAHLPRPGLTGKELEALADCTMTRLRAATFAKQAHMLVSWLRLVPPASAKEAHLNALQACGRALMKHKKSHVPAHPLPREGLAPFVEELLAREVEQNAPPLTPPMLQDIVKGLVQISWGLQRYQLARAKSRSLSIDDWSEIISKLVKYCEAHSITGQAASSSSTQPNTLTLAPPGLLPSWAAGTLFHVLWRAQQQQIPRTLHSELVQLSSLHSLLRLVRRYRNIHPEPEFFSWSVRLVDVHQRRGNVEDSLLADVVNELVPLLPETERAKLTRVIIARTPGALEEDFGQAAATPPAKLEQQVQQPRRLLQSSEEPADVQVVLAPALRQQPVPETSGSLAFATRMATGGRLWGLLSAQAMQAPPSEAGQALPEAVGSTPARVEVPTATETVSSVVLQAEGAVSSTQDSPHAQLSQAADTPVSTATVEELQRMLQNALLRVEALESKLASQEQSDAEAKDRCNTPADDAHHNICGSSDGWLTQMLQPAAEQIQPSPAAATLHLRRTFNFEHFRRAQSARLDSERVRVIVPPDTFPMWPIMKR